MKRFLTSVVLAATVAGGLFAAQPTGVKTKGGGSELKVQQISKTLVKPTESKKQTPMRRITSESIETIDDLYGFYCYNYYSALGNDAGFHRGSWKITASDKEGYVKVLGFSELYELEAKFDAENKQLIFERQHLFYSDYYGEDIDLIPIEWINGTGDVTISNLPIVFKYRDDEEFTGFVQVGSSEDGTVDYMMGVTSDAILNDYKGFFKLTYGNHLIKLSEGYSQDDDRAIFKFNPEQWEYCGEAMLQDGWMAGGYGSQDPYNVKCYKSLINPNEILLLNPYGLNSPYAFANSDPNQEGYILFNVADPECVLVKPFVTSGFTYSLDGEHITEFFCGNKEGVIYYLSEDQSLRYDYDYIKDEMMNQYGAVSQLTQGGKLTLPACRILFDYNLYGEEYWTDSEYNPYDMTSVIMLPEAAYAGMELPEEPVLPPVTEDVPPPLYIVGSGDFENGMWNPEEPMQFTYNANEERYYAEVNNLSTFKISTQYGDWDTFNQGALTCNEITEPGFWYDLRPVDYTEGGNILCPWKGDYTVVVNKEMTMIALVTTTPKPTEEAIYLRGSMNNWEALDEFKFEKSTDDENIYILRNVTIAVGDTFKVADANWSKVNYGTEETIYDVDTPIELYYNSGYNITSEIEGTYDFYFNLDLKWLWVMQSTEPVEPPTPPTPDDKVKEYTLFDIDNPGEWDGDGNGYVQVVNTGDGNQFTIVTDKYFSVTDLLAPNNNSYAWRVYKDSKFTIISSKPVIKKLVITYDDYNDSQYCGELTLGDNWTGVLDGSIYTITANEGECPVYFEALAEKQVRIRKIVITFENIETPEPIEPDPVVEEDGSMYLRGDFNYWLNDGFDDAYKFEDLGNSTYVCRNVSLSDGYMFKIGSQLWNLYDFGIPTYSSYVGDSQVYVRENKSLEYGGANIEYVGGEMDMDVYFNIASYELTLVPAGEKVTFPTRYTIYDRRNNPGEWEATSDGFTWTQTVDGKQFTIATHICDSPVELVSPDTYEASFRIYRNSGIEIYSKDVPMKKVYITYSVPAYEHDFGYVDRENPFAGALELNSGWVGQLAGTVYTLYSENGRILEGIARDWQVRILRIMVETGDYTTPDPIDPDPTDPAETVKLTVRMNGAFGAKFNVNKNTATLMEFDLDEYWEVESLLFNGKEVVGDLVNNTYVTPELTENSDIEASVRFAGDVEVLDETGVYTTEDDRIEIRAYGGEVHIKGLETGDDVAVYTLDGRVVAHPEVIKSQMAIALQGGMAYIVRVNDKAVKVML